MAEPFIGQIALFGFDFPPHNWAFCDGGLLLIQQSTALYSLIRNYYGGDGVMTFALPDFRGRSGVHHGEGPGLSPYQIGEMQGVDEVTLDWFQLPTHTHLPMANSSSANQLGPQNNFWALETAGQAATYSTRPPNAWMMSFIGLAGADLKHENRQPYLALRYCIALDGIYPIHP